MVFIVQQISTWPEISVDFSNHLPESGVIIDISIYLGLTWMQ